MMRYPQLHQHLRALVEGVPHPMANLANAAALLWQGIPDINWAGFYLLEGERLTLGPFQGKPACVEITVGRGVCGTAVAQNATIRVNDVHTFPGHIACDSESRAEIVIPLRKNGRIIGVLDIDSPFYDRFSAHDQENLEHFAEILQETL